MPNISEIRKKITVQLYKKYGESVPPEQISTLSEIRAYQEAIIPSPYFKYTLSDFTGRNKGKEILPLSVAQSAKQKLIDYCWSGVTLEQISDAETESPDMSWLTYKSSMHLRRDNGHNVVICADVAGKSGKTFCAALIMKEAIKQRVEQKYCCNTYQWINFSVLCRMLKEDDMFLPDYCSADWLVVDDIYDVSRSSPAQQSFISSLVNPFFADRVDSLFPTILVFRFDIDKIVVTDEYFGATIYKLINDKNTTIINLSGVK
jgi:hypothetical protein